MGRKPGNPGLPRQEMMDKFCRAIASGLSIRKACALPGMPSHQSVFNWFMDEPAFFEQYTRAREKRADARAEYIDDLCEDVKSGELDANAARVIIDAQKWQAGKENAKRYGEKLHLEGDLTHRLGDDAVESRLAHLAGKAGIAVAARGGGAEE